MAFCSKCGKEINEGAAFCDKCGMAVGGQPTNQQQPIYTGQPCQQPYQQQAMPPYQMYGYMPQKNIVQELSEKVNINAIIWLVVACIQYLIFIYGVILVSSPLLHYVKYFVDIFWLICRIFEDGWPYIFVLAVAIANKVVSAKDFKYSREVICKPVGILGKYFPVGGCVGMLIYNILLGGIIGVAGAIYAFVLRSFVVNNQQQFAQIEQQYMEQGRTL